MFIGLAPACSGVFPPSREFGDSKTTLWRWTVRLEKKAERSGYTHVRPTGRNCLGAQCALSGIRGQSGSLRRALNKPCSHTYGGATLLHLSSAAPFIYGVVSDWCEWVLDRQCPKYAPLIMRSARREKAAAARWTKRVMSFSSDAFKRRIRRLQSSSNTPPLR